MHFVRSQRELCLFYIHFIKLNLREHEKNFIEFGFRCYYVP